MIIKVSLMKMNKRQHHFDLRYFNITLCILLFSTLASQSTGLPKYLGRNCIYDPFTNLLSIFPKLEKSSEKFTFEMIYCLSEMANLFCTRNVSWKNAKCDIKQLKCTLLLIKKNSAYVFRTVLENKYNKSVNETIIRSPEKKCVDLHAEITDILLTDRNKFLIKWKVSQACGLGVFLSIFDSEGKEVYKKSLFRGDKSATIGDRLRQCTSYKICIKAIDCMSRCYNRSTKNVDIPKMNDLIFSENLVKNTLEFYWTDPSKNAETSSLNVFYNYTMFQGMNHSVQASVYSTKLSLPRPAVLRVVFSVKLCTPCGCGEEVSKEFQLKRKAPEHIARQDYAHSRLPLIVGLVAGSVLMVVLISCVLWKMRNTNHSSSEPQAVPVDIQEVDEIWPTPTTPIYDECSNPYDEVGHYDQLDDYDAALRS